LLSTLCALAAWQAAADQPSPARGVWQGTGTRHAILIGVEKYTLAPPLSCTTNDVKQLAMTLQDRGDYRVTQFIETADRDDRQPRSDVLRQQLPMLLAGATPDDTVLLYFTGHGFRDPHDGMLYLAPIDCDAAHPTLKGIPVAWLRDQLATCKAGVKFLVLDACHAGCEKGDEAVRSVVAKDLAQEFKSIAGVITLASSTSNEQSLIWEEKSQSLFSYWLNQGLRGHADRDGDGVVTIDELYQYVFDNVTYVAENRFSRHQTPARIVGPKTPGVASVIRLKPSTLKGTLDDMAEKLATSMQLRGLSCLGVPEFAVDAKKTELELGVDFGVLGRYCATELEGYLVTKSANRFDVIEHDSLQETLRTKGLTLKSLRSAATKDLAAGDKKMPAIALGILRSRSGQEVTLQCELRGTDRQNIFGSVGGLAMLNASEWAMLGRSAALSAQERIPDPPPLPGGLVRPPDASRISRLDANAQTPHPLLSDTFPYRAKIMVNNEERKGIFRGNDMYVPLSKGDVYEIWIENRNDQAVFMRLLVDGLNTLPEPPRAKNFVVEPRAGQQEYLPAQRVNMAEARAWLVDPGVVAVRGFFSRVGDDAKYNAFKVADAPLSAAGRQQFTEQLGLITAAFYVAKPKGSTARGSIGTALDKEYNTKIDSYGDFEPGEMIAVVHIHYVEPQAIEKLLR
jgi:hypothetical protein